MRFSYRKYRLYFKTPAGTSRGIYNTRDVWYVFLSENGICGIGECAPLPGLSREDPEEIEELLDRLSRYPEQLDDLQKEIKGLSSLNFALETALKDLRTGGKQMLFPSEFTKGKKGIPINGLIWMGNIDFMKKQIQEKLDEGYSCLKIKIGSLNFEDELELLRSIRKQYSPDQLMLRVDANGAFDSKNAHTKLNQLASLGIHSIEQPISTGQWENMAELCQNSPIAIALDEELIGIGNREEKQRLLHQIRPDFLILKPSLHGGLSGCEEWIEEAEKQNIEWWITSYLESNIGLNAIAQWTYTKGVSRHQGLGTGSLFTNNFETPLKILRSELCFDPDKTFHLPVQA